MADRDSNSDPLAQVAKPFLVLIGFVWVVAFALLILQLVSNGGEVDGNALILLGVMLGIALLPFVSQFSVAGLFEFKREFGKLSDKVDAVQNAVASISAASANAQQQTTASPTAQVFVGTELRELASRAAQNEAEAAEASVGEAVDVRLPAWKEKWNSFEDLVTLNFFLAQGLSRGVEAVKDIALSNERRFELGLDVLRKDALLRSRLKLPEDLEQVLKTNTLIREDGQHEGADYAESFRKLAAITGALAGKLNVYQVFGAAAYSTISETPEAAVSFMSDLGKRIEELKASRAD